MLLEPCILNSLEFFLELRGNLLVNEGIVLPVQEESHDIFYDRIAELSVQEYIIGIKDLFAKKRTVCEPYLVVASDELNQLKRLSIIDLWAFNFVESGGSSLIQSLVAFDLSNIETGSIWNSCLA